MLVEKTKEIIKSTIPVLETHGEAITTRFYQRMFASRPELLNIFNQTNQRQGRQQTALANAVYAAAVHIDNLENILPAVRQIGHKHRALGVLPEHYPIVGEHLLAAIKEILQDDATDEILGAWAEAYGAIADAFIGVEHSMYEDAAAQPGGWADFREFVVTKKVKESEVITSFYLEPSDKKQIASYQPGQYVTVKVHIPGQPYIQIRHYSLSDVPGLPYYRISVKREDGGMAKPAGLISTFLHEHIQEGDTLWLSAPAGEFVLDLNTRNPIVFLSGGVGMTPLVSMLKTLLKQQPNQQVTYVHAARDGSVHAMKESLEELANAHDNLNYYIVYQNPSEGDKARPFFAKEGYIDLTWIQSIASQDSTFYFCGPQPFMQTIYQGLKTWGLKENQIKYEFFGPQGSLEA